MVTGERPSRLVRFLKRLGLGTLDFLWAAAQFLFVGTLVVAAILGGLALVGWISCLILPHFYHVFKPERGSFVIYFVVGMVATEVLVVIYFLVKGLYLGIKALVELWQNC